MPSRRLRRCAGARAAQPSSRRQLSACAWRASGSHASRQRPRTARRERELRPCSPTSTSHARAPSRGAKAPGAGRCDARAPRDASQGRARVLGRLGERVGAFVWRNRSLRGVGALRGCSAPSSLPAGPCAKMAWSSAVLWTECASGGPAHSDLRTTLFAISAGGAARGRRGGARATPHRRTGCGPPGPTQIAVASRVSFV